MSLSRAEIEDARRKVAHFMVEHDRPQFAPIFDRLTNELAKLDKVDRTMEAARKVLGER